MAAEKITIFLQTGEPQRIRTAEISGWVGKCVAGPKTDIELLFVREEAEKPSVYFLIGQDPKNAKWTVYIGEAENLKKRFVYHRADESWFQFIAFVSKDDSLTKAHIRYLEGRLIEEAKSVGRFQVRNDNHSGAKLPEADREDMEAYLKRIRQLLPLLGCEVLIPVRPPGNDEEPKLIGRVRNIIAHGQRTPKGFVVFAGSQASKDYRGSASPWMKEAKEKLIAEKKLVLESGLYKFTSDCEFSSPSTAAVIICGGHCNGLDWWRNQDGRSLKEIESA